MKRDPTAAVTLAAGAGDFEQLARLAFATRQTPADGERQALPLALLPADVLEMDLEDPEQRDFGDYELLEKIGQGGMGVVYRAHQHSLQREVALKLLGAGPWASTDFVDRFRREAQSAAQLEHPNIVTVFEAGTQHDLHFFSMRLVRGESLAEKLRREGPLAEREAARLLRTVAEAVDYAHRLGVLHLDLKPGNVLIDGVGEPLVADFGLARRIDQALTEDGDDVSGTPSYMAPEQALAESQRIGRGTDIYGLGSILYELLTGRPPFLGASPQATLLSVVAGELVAPRALVPRLSADLEAICLKCLHRDPARRYASATALADDLRAFLEDRAVSVRRPAPLEALRRWVRREPKLALAVSGFFAALCVGLVVASQQWWRAETSAQAARALLWESRRDAALQAAREGRGFDALGALLQNLGEQSGIADDPLAEARDRRELGVLLGQGVRLIDRLVIADANPLAAALSPDGRWLVLALNDLSLRWFDTGSLVERGRLSLSAHPAMDGEHRAPLLLRFVSDSRVLVYPEWVVIHAAPNPVGTLLVDLRQSRVIAPPRSVPMLADAVFSDDGRHAVLRTHEHRAQLWQVEPWRALSALSAPLASSTREMENLGWLVGPDARHLVRMQFGHREVLLLDRQLKERARVRLPGSSRISAWAMDPQGRRMALGGFEGRVFLVDLDSAKARSLPANRGREVSWLTFSEDGRWLASASLSGLAQVFDTGTGDLLAGGAMAHDHPLRRVHLHRGQRLLVAEGEGRTSIWRLPLPGPRAASAQRIALGPSEHALVARYPLGSALAVGLLASAGVDGQVRLWRLPASALLPGRAAQQFASGSGLAESRRLDVHWNRLRLADRSGRFGAWQTLAHPPGFAEWLPDDRLLLSVGDQLELRRSSSSVAAVSHIPLPATPQRMALSADGGQAVLSIARSGAGGIEDTLHRVDLQRGQLLASAEGIEGPIRHMQFDARGEHLLTVGPTQGSTRLLRSRDLAVLAEFPHDSYEPVQWADFAADGSLLLVTRAPDLRLGQDHALRWDPRSDEVLEEIETSGVRPLAIIALPDGSSFVAGSDADLLLRNGRIRVLPRRARGEATAVLALDPQRRLLARGFRQQVQLHDAGSGDPIGLPLDGEVNAVDTIVRLDFSADGSELIGRTVLGHWLRWPVAAESRGLDTLRGLQASAQWLTPNQRVLYAAGRGERAALRAQDPGPLAAAEPVERLAAVRTLADGSGIPPRPELQHGGMVDLGPWYDVSPESVLNPLWNLVPHLRPMPLGLLRFGAVYFDVRGLVQVGVRDWVDPGGASPRAEGLRCLPAPSARVDAVHLLATVMLPEPMPTGTLLGEVQFRYRDGGRRSLPLRAGIELPGYSGSGEWLQIAMAADLSAPLLGHSSILLTAPRIANPEPEREVECLDLQAGGEATRPLAVLALTTSAAQITTANGGNHGTAIE